MLKKTITYTDYNNVERTEDFWFNLTESEIVEMEVSEEGGLQQYLERITKTNDAKKIVDIMKQIILKAYGEKSSDGRRFIKVDAEGHNLASDFAQTPAYSKLFMEVAFDAQEAAKFIKAIFPTESLKAIVEK